MNKICRICFEEGVLSSIFTKNYNLAVCDMIEYCTNIKIQRNDGLPEQMCSNCAYKLGIAFHFKQTCESSDIRLRQYLGLDLVPKHCDATVMTDPIVTTTKTIIKKCKCSKLEQKKYTNYKRKAESERLKRGPKPKPKKVIECYNCQKQFRCQSQLDMHIRTHTGDRPFSCMFCSRSFTQKHNLTIHMRLHTGEKPFQCEICSKSFSAQGNLQAHIKTHTGQKDHICEVCKKGFVTSSELTRHMTKHTGIRNFKCDICEKTFSQKRDLKLHKTRKHGCSSVDPPTETFNTNIDIINVDEANLPTTNIKTPSHYIHLGNKPSQNTGMMTEANPFNQKAMNFSHSVFG